MVAIPSVPASFAYATVSSAGQVSGTFLVPVPSPGKRWSYGYIEVVHTTSGQSGYWQDNILLGGFAWTFYGPDGFGYHNHLGTFDEKVTLTPDGYSNSTQGIFGYLNANAGQTVPFTFRTFLSGFYTLTDSITSLVLYLDEAAGNTVPQQTNCPSCADCHRSFTSLVGGRVNSGECNTFCAETVRYPNAGAPSGQWNVTSSGGTADDQHPYGWSVGRMGDCSLKVCAPCISNYPPGAELYFEATYWLGETYTDDLGQVWDLALHCCFVVVVKLICEGDQPPPSDAGVGSSVSYDVSDARRHVRMYTSGSSVKIGFASNALPLTWHDVATSLSGSHPCVRYDRQSQQSALYAATDGIAFYKSLDEGITWTLVTNLLPGSTHPAFVITRDGRRHFFGVLRKGVNPNYTYEIHGIVLDAAGNTILPEFTAIASCDDDSLACDEFVSSAGQWNIGLLYRSGGAIQYVTSTDGKTFS